MRRAKLICASLLIFFSVALLPTISMAHSGRTDSKGGHYNRSTGEYHYHHGYPAHQHIDGVCPYDYDDKTGSSSGSSSTGTSSSQSQSVQSDVSEPSEPRSTLIDDILLSCAAALSFSAFLAYRPAAKQAYEHAYTGLFVDSKPVEYPPLAPLNPITNQLSLYNPAQRNIERKLYDRLVPAIWKYANSIKPIGSTIDEYGRPIETGVPAHRSRYYVSVNTRTGIYHHSHCQYYTRYRHLAHEFDAMRFYVPCSNCRKKPVLTDQYMCYLILLHIKGGLTKENVLLWTDGWFTF